MKTQNEIVAKVEEIKSEDIFGFKTNDLLEFLDFEHAKPYLIEGATEDQWEQGTLARENILKKMEDYMSFAWEKANNCRGISAGRSLAHYTVWIWLIGDEEKFGDLENYNYYGKDNLIKICEEYGWDSDQWDDGKRTN